MLLPQRYDEAALIALSEANPLLKFEQSSEGYLIVSPTASPGNKGEVKLLTQIENWNEAVNFGEIRGIRGGIALPKGGDYGPDAFVVSHDVWSNVPHSERRKVYVPVLPTAIFELLSPSNRYDNRFKKKLRDYARSAVPLVVILDPQAATTTIRRPRCEDEVNTTNIVTFPELPGLDLNVDVIFAACNE